MVLDLDTCIVSIAFNGKDSGTHLPVKALEHICQ